MKRRDWTEDELIVLASMYFRADFSLGDDAREECQTIATCFERTASAVDRQWRNMDAVVKGKDGNIGQLVKLAVSKYLSDPSSYQKLAEHICDSRNWPLKDLIREGKLRDEHRPIRGNLSRAVQSRLEKACAEVSFTTFPSGSQGFEVDRDITIGEQSYRLVIRAVAAGSNHNPDIKIKTRIPQVVLMLQSAVAHVQPKRFITERIGYYGATKYILDDQTYHITIRAVVMGEDE